eukprot:TRINITY_DN23435_c0_g1_i1.p1 TRINITY_DN23435_c0_g1~~TRINITY_DN23435_c0_g1_i1.p1  ORF type:complete len:638 (-),score=138.90 TRINITY_DN23435_c0_g1_i1:661-2574(-)
MDEEMLASQSNNAFASSIPATMPTSAVGALMGPWSPTAFKLLAIVAVVIMSFAGAFLPLRLISMSEMHRSRITSVSRYFTAGVFLGVGLMHMLPEADEGLTALGYGEQHFPLAYFVAALGFVLVWVAEKCGQQVWGRERERVVAVAAQAEKQGGGSICYVQVESVATYGPPPVFYNTSIPAAANSSQPATLTPALIAAAAAGQLAPSGGAREQRLVISEGRGAEGVTWPHGEAIRVTRENGIQDGLVPGSVAVMTATVERCRSLDAAVDAAIGRCPACLQQRQQLQQEEQQQVGAVRGRRSESMKAKAGRNGRGTVHSFNDEGAVAHIEGCPFRQTPPAGTGLDIRYHHHHHHHHPSGNHDASGFECASPCASSPADVEQPHSLFQESSRVPSVKWRSPLDSQGSRGSAASLEFPEAQPLIEREEGGGDEGRGLLVGQQHSKSWSHREGDGAGWPLHEGESCEAASLLHEHLHGSLHRHVVLEGRGALSFLLAALLSLHSFVVGVALGTSQSVESAVSLLIALLAHKGAEAFSVGVQFVKEKVPMEKTVAVLLLYCAMTPLGIASGMVATLAEGAAGAAVASFVQAFGAGTVLYVVMHSLSEHEVSVGGGSNDDVGVVEIFLLLAGLAVMSAVSVFS